MGANYCFSGMKYHICGLEVKPLPEYDVFKSESAEKEGNINIDVDVHIVEELPEISGKRVYTDISGVHVYLHGTKEYRYFANLYTGEYFALLEEDCKETDRRSKKLFVLKQLVEQGGMDDRRLLNFIAPEKDLARNNRLLLHSSFIECEKGAILFTAPCQTGKSTQAELWRKYRGAQVHNGDRSLIWREDGIWYAGGIPWCGTSGIMHNVEVPLAAIIVLSQAPQNGIRRLKLREFMADVMSQTTINPWDAEMIAAARNTWLDLFPDIPVYHLACLPDEGAVNAVAKELGIE